MRTMQSMDDIPGRGPVQQPSYALCIQLVGTRGGDGDEEPRA